jgi:hypothetical protein
MPDSNGNRQILLKDRYPEPRLVGDRTMGLLGLVWRLIRLPIWTFLVILQPVVGLVFGGLALLGVLMSLFFKLSGATPHFPFMIILATRSASVSP